MTLRVFYQGEPGSFSEAAARRVGGRSAVRKPVPSFAQVFAHAGKSRDAIGIVPIENSVFGSIHQTYDLLLRHKVQIVGETEQRIELNLLALPGAKLPDIRRIYSQPQALGQCEDFLGSLEDVEVHPYHDTAAAARMIRELNDHSAAAIASAQAGRLHGLRLLRKNVETNRHNFTRFIVIARPSARSRGRLRRPKTSLVLAARDVPGALFKAMAVFALRDINLLKIESRPLIGRPWDYLFYLDVEGDAADPAVRSALNQLQEVSTFVRVLGTYERARPTA
jgi:prephenate dehydratase